MHSEERGMNVLKTLAVVGVVIGGLVAWDAFKPEGGLKAVVDHIDAKASQGTDGAGGFAAIPLPDGVSAHGVVIFAPENCPSEAAQRARRLASHLSAERIPYRETSRANFSTLASQAEANRVMSVMNGPVPVVYVNGRAKANPTPEEVVAEYRRGRSG
jgi:hypothetical protein